MAVFVAANYFPARGEDLDPSSIYLERSKSKICGLPIRRNGTTKGPQMGSTAVVIMG